MPIKQTISTKGEQYWSERTSVQGAFSDLDFLLFDKILAGQSVSGDLLEIGAYVGKSAILLGLHAGVDEVIVNDIFDAHGLDEENTLEVGVQYPGLTRGVFLENYTRYAAEPRIVQAFSKEIGAHVAEKSLRFAHIDGGHLYEQVREDIDSVRRLLTDVGVVVLDDFRAVHTPGVAAAVWESVAQDGLIPFCLSDAKFYGTWSRSTASEAVSALTQWFAEHPEVNHGRQKIHGHSVVVVTEPPIWTPRRVARSMVPQLILDKVRPGPRPYLGS